MCIGVIRYKKGGEVALCVRIFCYKIQLSFFALLECSVISSNAFLVLLACVFVW